MKSSTVELDDPYFFRSRDSWREPWPAYRRLRDESPVRKVTQDDDVDFWVLSRFADVFEAARDTATFSSAQGLVPTKDAMAMFEDNAAPIVMMDPPDHTAMRRLVSRPLTPRRVALVEDAVRAFVDERLDRLAAAVRGALDRAENADARRAFERRHVVRAGPSDGLEEIRIVAPATSSRRCGPPSPSEAGSPRWGATPPRVSPNGPSTALPRRSGATSAGSNS